MTEVPPSAEVGQSAGPIALVLANSLAMLLRAALGRMWHPKTRGKQGENKLKKEASFYLNVAEAYDSTIVPYRYTNNQNQMFLQRL